MSPHRRYRHGDPRRTATRIRVWWQRIGRRGQVLTGLGLTWVLSGITVFATPGSKSYLLLSIWQTPRAILWIGTGLVAIIFAGRPQGDDTPGWLALYFMAGYRVLAYAHGFIDWLVSPHVPGLPGDGDPRGIVGVIAWGVIAWLIYKIAGWPEPSPPTTVPETETRQDAEREGA